MANFESMLKDLRDCFHHIDDELSPEERKAMKRLIKLCHQIAREVNIEALI